MKISTKYIAGVIIVILVVLSVYLSIESIKWYGKSKIFLAIFTALLVGSAIGYQISKSLSKNFSELKTAAKNISDGDFSQNVNIKTEGYFVDETADIAISINMMLESLRGLANHLTDTSVRVLKSSLNLYKLSDQVSEATSDISHSFDYVNKGAAKQLDMIERALNIINEIAKSSEVIAQYAREAEVFEKQSTQNARTGGQAAKEILVKLESVFNKVELSAEQAMKFGNITEKIATIVDVITSIAKQTNILALNASIEATKAGEAGKGFSSVVSDIKSMSEDSKNAAKQISEMLKEIGSESDKIVRSMKQSSNEITEGRRMLRVTDTTLERIISLVSETEVKVSKISALTATHLAKTNEIVTYVNEVATLSQENKNATENIAEASEDQQLSIAEMSESAQEMNNLSEELKDLTSKFKLK
ncbi:methyl-accepting chemotaxis protein [Thermodesulfobacteriota bacterium]